MNNLDTYAMKTAEIRNAECCGNCLYFEEYYQNAIPVASKCFFLPKTEWEWEPEPLQVCNHFINTNLKRRKNV